MTSTLIPEPRPVAPSGGSGSSVASYLAGFHVAGSADGEPAWLQRRREGAIEGFREIGFPTTREEDWRFTNVAPVAQREFRRAGVARGVRPGGLERHALAEPGSSRLVFLNGRLAPELSQVIGIPPGVKLGSLRRALAVDGGPLEQYLGRYAPLERRPFSALNLSLFEDGACLYVPADVEVDAPIELIFLNDPAAAGAAVQPRNLLILDRGARASLIETYASLADQDSFTNPVTELILGDGAAAEHTKLQLENGHAYHIGTTHVHQGRDSRLRSFSVLFGASLGRNDLDVVLAGPGAECHLSGLYVAGGRQLLDNHTSIRHLQPQCASREVYKGILDDAAHAVFNGKVYVAPEAQKTDGKQTNRNLLLSDGARVDTKPQLEIFADDVKCTHGATVGRLDELALFYLRSRGLGTAVARKLLIYAFAAEILEEIPHLGLRQRLEGMVMNRLDSREAR